MRVLVDATAIPADRGGVGRYVENLVPALVAVGVEVVVACQARDREVFAERTPRAELVSAPAVTESRPARLVWEQVGLPRVAARVGADVLHSTHYTMPHRSPVPVVVTLHDATFFSHPGLHRPMKARFFRAATRRAVRSAAGIVVPSEATAQEVRRFVGGPAALFHVAYHGVDTSVFRPVDAEEQRRVADRLGVGPEGYVGFLGTLEPRKNVPALVGAWVDAVGDRPHPPALVLAGGPGWDTDVEPAIAAVPPGLRVIRPGYLPVADLPGFLAGAAVIAYPSLGEGFGLPVLEAMACGAAVLTSRALSLPEVGGDAVAYCDVDRAAIAQALRDLLDDDKHRRALARAAGERAARFTWDAAAGKHLEAYQAALQAHRGG